MSQLPPATRKLHPAWIALLAALLVLLVAFLPALWRTFHAPPAAPHTAQQQGAPWSIEVLAQGGTRVFGLRLPGSTLADALALWGDELQLALMASREQPAALEAYVERPGNGPVSGRLVLSAEAAPEALARWRLRAAKETPVSADTRRITLRADDLAEALRTPLVGIGFIPATQLDAATLRQRFGEPAQRVHEAGDATTVEHWLYPERGLAIVLDAKGRELLQYVAPADFERRLRAPLGATRPAR
ncbi:MAG TPA: hypothetical protein VIW70_08845 [Rubrivivax sp.]